MLTLGHTQTCLGIFLRQAIFISPGTHCCNPGGGNLRAIWLVLKSTIDLCPSWLGGDRELQDSVTILVSALGPSTILSYKLTPGAVLPLIDHSGWGKLLPFSNLSFLQWKSDISRSFWSHGAVFSPHSLLKRRKIPLSSHDHEVRNHLPLSPSSQNPEPVGKLKAKTVAWSNLKPFLS